MPIEFLKAMPDPQEWSRQKLLHWATQMRVNPEPLCYALQAARLMTRSEVGALRRIKLSREAKQDPEIPMTNSQRSQEPIRELLARGMSRFHVELCFEAYSRGDISAGRAAEMLLTDEAGLHEIAALYGTRVAYDD